MRKLNLKLSYSFAVAAAAAALLLTKSVTPLADYYAFDLFLGAVFFSAWFGGFGPGILSTALSALSMSYFLMPPFNAFSFAPVDLVRLIVFGGMGLIVSSMSSKLRAAQALLQREHTDLERRLKERTQEVLAISSREQQRMGQDLHDGLCQTLAGTRLLTEALHGKLSGKSFSETDDIAKIQSRLAQAQAQASAVTHGLYPVELETEGFMVGLEELAERTASTYNVRCEFVYRNPLWVYDHGFASHLYRIAQEAVMNSVKNGKARNITLRLITLGRRRILAVLDDGIGFSPEMKPKGMGMKIMDYRARMIGATLEFRRRKTKGMLVACSFQSPNQ